MLKAKVLQLTRSYEWWDHKTPQILSIAYATSLMTQRNLFDLLSPAFLMIFGALVLIAVYASVINDYTDLRIDIACGKSNMMQRLRYPVRLLLMVFSFCLVMGAAYSIYPNIYGVTFYLLIGLSISLYSFPPIRLKERGIWGVVTCASAEHLFPTLFAISVVSFFADFKPSYTWFAAAGTLSLFYGIRSILWHQFLDKENDLESGINTFASQVDPESFKSRSKLIICVELFALASVLYLVNLWTPIFFLITYILFIIWRRKDFKSEIIVLISPKSGYFQILMLDFYSVFFPISLLCYAALTQRYGWVVLFVHLLLFYKIILLTLKDAYHLINNFRK